MPNHFTVSLVTTLFRRATVPSAAGGRSRVTSLTFTFISADPVSVIMW